MASLPPVRQKLHDLMQATVQDEAARRDWFYRAVRPMPVPASWHPGQQIVGDCSTGVRYLCKWAGAPDPMDPEHNSFNPYGNSQTMWLHLQHLGSRSDLLVGDVVTFGAWGSEHAAMVYKAGADPTVWSFGHQGAPEFYPLSYDRREQQYLRLPVTYTPTHDDKLRARTGWFAWVAWKLGEGDWRHHKPADPAVRPDVPRRIPVQWWARYVQFMANRKKAN